MFDALLFAGGLGTRMGSLTQNIAKPALKIGGETLIGRLARQVYNLDSLSTLYINCSYQPKSIVSAINEIELRVNPIFLWERELMGTAWTLSKVAERSKRDLLVLHGDLYLGSYGIEQFVHKAKTNSKNSSIAIHRREISRARSIVDVDNNSQLVNSFAQVPVKSHGKNTLIEDRYVWSNSGIYYFQYDDLRNFRSHDLVGLPLESSILTSLVQSQSLKAIEYIGRRFSVETSKDLEVISLNSSSPTD